VLERGLEGRGLSLPAGLGVFTWIDYVQDYLNYEATESGSTRVLCLLLFALSFLGISNTILLAILERTKEIGMMRAMGMTDAEMTLAYMLEAAFLGLIGSVLGVIVGCLINYPMVKYGLDISSLNDAMGGSAGFRVASRLRSAWNIPMIAMIGIVAAFIASIVAFFPVRRALKLPITESLRFE
jgi:ABC-type lipoprotein release transport system permease subunit